MWRREGKAAEAGRKPWISLLPLADPPPSRNPTTAFSIVGLAASASRCRPRPDPPPRRGEAGNTPRHRPVRLSPGTGGRSDVPGAPQRNAQTAELALWDSRGGGGTSAGLKSTVRGVAAGAGRVVGAGARPWPGYELGGVAGAGIEEYRRPWLARGCVR